MALQRFSGSWCNLHNSHFVLIYTYTSFSSHPGYIAACNQSCHHFLLASRSRSCLAMDAKPSASLDIASILSCSVRSFSPRSASLALFSSINPLSPSTLHAHPRPSFQIEFETSVSCAMFLFITPLSPSPCVPWFDCLQV